MHQSIFQSTARMGKVRRNSWNVVKCGPVYCTRYTIIQTSWKRHKSAPYLRLKNRRRTWKCQSILLYSNRKTQKLDRIGALKGGPFGISQHFCRKTSRKLKGRPFGGKNSPKKVPQCRKKWNGGPFSLLARYFVALKKKNNSFG